MKTGSETAGPTLGGLLAGRRGIMMGVATDRSLAWGIAQKAQAAGADLLYTFPNEAIGRRLRELVGPDHTLIPCDVSRDDDIDRAFASIDKAWGGAPIDFIVHAVSFSDKDELTGPYLHTSRRGFALALDVSCYSLTAVAQRAAPRMSRGGSLLTLTYLGSERVIPNYNVMGVAKAALEASVRYLAADLGPSGIRVNAISAGPIRTLAASGIAGMRHIVKWTELNAPLRRPTTIEDVGHAALSLLSELGSGVTGEVVHVDGGYHVVGMVAAEEAERSAVVLQGIGAEVHRRSDAAKR